MGRALVVIVIAICITIIYIVHKKSETEKEIAHQKYFWGKENNTDSDNEKEINIE